MTVQRIVSDVRRALGYLLDAARLIKRHPALLLLPVVLVLFNAAEGYVGRRIMEEHTAYGRWLVEQLRRSEGLVPEGARKPHFSAVKLEMGGAPDAVSLPLTGTAGFLHALVMGRPGEETAEPIPSPLDTTLLIAAVLMVGLIGPVNAFVEGGYYATLMGAARTGVVPWGGFAGRALRFLVRFWLWNVILAFAFLLLLSAVTTIMGSGAVAGTAWEAWVWGAWVWSVKLAAFVLVLTPFVLVWDDCGLWTAVRKAVRTAVADVLAAFVLVVAGVAAGKLVTWLFSRLWLATYEAPAQHKVIPWASLGVGAAHRCILAVVGVLLAAAFLLWYRDASARLWPQAEEETGPTGADA